MYAGVPCVCVGDPGEEVFLTLERQPEELGSEALEVRLGRIAFRAPELDDTFMRIGEKYLHLWSRR